MESVLSFEEKTHKIGLPTFKLLFIVISFL